MMISHLEYHALLNPVLAIPLLLPVPIAWHVVSRFQREAAHVDRQLIFEEHGSADFELLNLDQRS